MPPAPKHTRRWFQLSLGIMFLLLTVCAIWMAWELKFIRERKHVIASLGGAKGGGYFSRQMAIKHGLQSNSPATEIPFWRRWMGDEAMSSVILNPCTAAEKERISNLFPEAVVQKLDASLKSP